MTIHTRSERLEARITPELKDLLEQAADLQGVSVSAFVKTSLFTAARCALMDHDRLVLDASERDTFISALINPPDPSDNLRRAAEQYRALMGV